jgi:DNA-binding winged helix-turn-helix (wHTH) protein/tetratricopeptide (TPR) repeat protein
MASEAPTIVLAHAAPFRIGAMEVRPGTREVIGPSAREVIEPRVMQVLVALAQASGEIVSRDDLIACCWEGRVVGEDAINRVISKVRKLCDTVGAGSARLETITKVGYRLLTDESAPIPGALAAVKPRFSRRALLAGGGALLAAGGGAAWFALRDDDGVPAEAEPYYQQGLEAMRIGLTERNAEGIGFLRRAAEIAPQSAQVWGALAVAYQQSRNSLPPREAQVAQERSRSAARRALELDPDNPAAHGAMLMDMPLFGNWLAVERSAIKSSAVGRFDAGGVLNSLRWNVGRTREALDSFETLGAGKLIQPLVQYRYAMLLWAAGRLDEADRVTERSLSLWPRNFAIWFGRFWMLARTGRPQEALALSANRAVRPTGIPDWNFEVNDLNARAFLTRAPADVEAALAAYRRAAPMGAGFVENAIQFAAPAGLLDEAFRFAEAYYFGRHFRVSTTRFTTQQGGYTPRDRLVTHILFAPSTRAMRRDPRFLPLVEELGLVEYWRRSGTRPDTAAEMGLRL